MDIDSLSPLLQSMIRVEAGCWFAFNKYGSPQKVAYDAARRRVVPIASWLWQLNGGTCEKSVRFMRTCGHDDCVNPDHMVIETLGLRLGSYIDARGPDECWLWTGAVDADGYGVIFRDGKTVPAHRAVWEQAKGPIPPGLLIRHLCNNRLCCNPAHMALGTNADNSADAVTCGSSKRMGRQPGDSERVAAAILAVKDGATMAEAAARYGVSRVSLWRNMRKEDHS